MSPDREVNRSSECQSYESFPKYNKTAIQISGNCNVHIMGASL